jgi:hypothetical protein
MRSIAIKNYPKPLFTRSTLLFWGCQLLFHVAQLVFCGLGEVKRGCATTLMGFRTTFNTWVDVLKVVRDVLLTSGHKKTDFLFRKSAFAFRFK